MDILLNPLTKALGWTIIHSLWQGAIVYVLLVGLLKFYPKLSSGLKYNLSFSAMVGISGWALLTFSNELIKFKNATGAQDYHYQLNNAAIDSLPSLMDRSIPLLVMIYLIGICFHVSFLIFDYYKMNTLRTTGLSSLTPDLQRQFYELASGMGITKEVWFNISSKVTVPIVVGYLKPVILLPLSAITQLDSKQLESIIIHELSHIRRNDYLLNLAKIFMETILFFNPFVLMTGRIINIERENACDDLVVGMTNDPLLYVESLLEIQKINYYQDRFSLASTGKKYYLLERIKRLTNGDVTNFHIKQPLTLLAILSLLFLLAWAPVKVKRVINPVSVVKKEVQVEKTPVREKSEKQKSLDAPKSNSQLIQNDKVTVLVTEKQSKSEKLQELIVAGLHRTGGTDTKANQLISVGNMTTPGSGSQAKEEPDIIMQTSEGKQVLGSINTEDNRTTFSENPPADQQKTVAVQSKSDDTPESQTKTTTGFLKPDNTISDQQRPSTSQTKSVNSRSNEPIIVTGYPRPK